ncbi:hypothetical protein HY491_03975 [Candidatus Woesearchaeota archaeon]|nr:hypothetical protein [Candidatus Woesearchaeota archaeon]
MPLAPPDSMDDCIYFTRRAGDGTIMAWVQRMPCPQCKKGRMGKPLKKNGKVDKKSPFYTCPSCNYQEQSQEHEAKLNLEIIYTCPKCSHQGETAVPYKRKLFQGVQSYIFACQKCNTIIPITKKMKDIKERGQKDEEPEPSLE